MIPDEEIACILARASIDSELSGETRRVFRSLLGDLRRAKSAEVAALDRALGLMDAIEKKSQGGRSSKKISLL